MFAARIHKRHHYIGVLLYEKHCRSALKKCLCEGHVKLNTETDFWGSFTLSWCAFHHPLIWSHYCFIFSVCSELLIASGFEK